MTDKQQYWLINVAGEMAILDIAWVAFRPLAGSADAPFFAMSVPARIAALGGLVVLVATYRTQRHFRKSTQ